jgi:hypothetical protein
MVASCTHLARNVARRIVQSIAVLKIAKVDLVDIGVVAA